ncbi:hypothetical protein D6D17_04030 [Aureobasidium pullulans]|nr:hypothetical protein D6D17_04030 [Aureobasidium pullulans]THY84004.1 hypothetical protein D6C93_08683 [Aureobasidium pullulans]TIA57381.1 hypothetical protein D6C77_06224 [Aureobasidium pullulans]
MALHRGIQSALFFYLSCAPCTGYSYRKKRRKEADRDREDKRALEIEQPGLYRHPSPFATNVHWQTEIDLGPSPAPGKRRNGQKKGRTRTSDENASNVASSVNLGLTQNDSNDSTWNLRNWQRDDDEDDNYWGASYPYRSSRRPSTNGASTISRPLTARTATTDRSNATSYYSVSNPPINDLHPPIVTRIDTPADAMWMLQPPPPARLAKNGSKTNLARSDSGASRPSTRRATNENLSRQVSQRIVDEKLRNGQSPSMDSLNPSSSTDDLKPSRRRRPPPPINVQEDTSNPRHLIPVGPPVKEIRPTNSPSKFLLPPQPLSPVMSHNSRERSRSRSRKRNSSAEDRKPWPDNKQRQDSSLNVLQELVPANSLLNSQRLNKSPSFEARIELPTADQYEEMMLLGSGKAGFDSWYEGKDFGTFPQWAAERVRRDVSQRWSVDF